MNLRDREVVKLALLHLQATLVDFYDQLEQESPTDEVSYLGTVCEPPKADEIEYVLKQFQDV